MRAALGREYSSARWMGIRLLRMDAVSSLLLDLMW